MADADSTQLCDAVAKAVSEAVPTAMDAAVKKTVAAAAKEAVAEALVTTGVEPLTRQRALDASEAARRFGAEAIRMAFLFNGGAIVALLAWMGSNTPPQWDVGWPMLGFGVGAVAALFSAVFAYMAQDGYSAAYMTAAGNDEKSWFKQCAGCWQVAALGALIGSVVAGAAASMCAHSEFERHRNANEAAAAAAAGPVRAAEAPASEG